MNPKLIRIVVLYGIINCTNPMLLKLLEQGMTTRPYQTGIRVKDHSINRENKLNTIQY